MATIVIQISPVMNKVEGNCEHVLSGVSISYALDSKDSNIIALTTQHIVNSLPAAIKQSQEEMIKMLTALGVNISHSVSVEEMQKKAVH
ncbi:hypothetical protein VSX61_08660 [Brenneria populi subsp. brevivirga]|uniref:Uncharacterized protein n=1 Tax=Brenneria alni TaxID=71656 RepID=A0A421DNI3_9GAMM|nr:MULTISPECIES: hypothetical protein [Brenneria]MEC5319006.1 hypothetical protein [Brenneria populi subsp. brevivirga]RLM23635.1 hypothetical protein BIY29_10050 [Brenneria alni]